MGAAYQCVTMPPDQTKNQVVLHVESPTKPYRILCSRCETDWWIWFGLPTVTTVQIWAGHHYNIVLPCLTSRGVKYTHDINDTVLHGNRGPLGLCGISPASNQKEITVGDPPTPRHNVPTRHAASTLIHGGRAEGLDPTTTPFPAYDPIYDIEALLFGKEFLRMAGIVQMLHRHRPPYDKYPYHAHPKRIRATQPRTQA